MSSAEASHAKASALPEMVKDSTIHEADYGQNKPAWFAKLNQGMSGWRTRQPSLFADLESSLETWPRWGIMLDGECFHVEMQEDTTSASGYGFLLPTIGKNEFKGASSKRFWDSQDYRGAKMAEGVRTSKLDPIYLSPSFSEEAMKWPIMWTALAPLETDRFQQWLNSHGTPS